jgi:hypothetical protein
MIEFICECGDADCTMAVSLTQAEYEQLRADFDCYVAQHSIPEKSTTPSVFALCLAEVTGGPGCG